MSEIKETNTEKKATILLVEDNPTQAMQIYEALEDAGATVAWAQDGIDGLEMAETSHPDVILLDVQLPRMNGFQVCQNLKENEATAGIPVIMLTRHDDPEALQLGIQIGAVDYIPKDAFATAVLLETLRQMHLI